MDPKKEADVVKEALQAIDKEDLVRFILERLESKEVEKIPISIFKTSLSPLESITRYLKERHKTISQIAKLLNKQPASISQAYKSSQLKDFNVEKTDIFIPLSEFTRQPKLSILEVVVSYLKKQNLGLTTIGKLLGKSPKTIWTINDRAKKKNA